jgi:DNA-binding CsgD family transcriptional regulator
MPSLDQLLQAIETIHAAGLDETRWPQALSSMTRLCGGAGATIEVFDKTKRRFRAFHSVGLPTSAEQPYLEYWAARNPRVAHGQRQKSGEIGCDYQILDEAAMDRDGFYSELLPAASFRYFVSTVAINSPTIFAAAAVQRTRKQGHVGGEEIETMRRLTPHLQQALDVSMRLSGARHAAATFEQSIGWLDDGVALVRSDGRIVSCNSAFARMAADGDGIRTDKGAIVFGARDAQARLAKALASANRLRNVELDGAVLSDFPVRRPSDAPAYIVSLRPLLGTGRPMSDAESAVAIVFIRDPLVTDNAALRMLRELFGLTAAEGALAHALQRGVSPVTYARENALSPNTVYTHLRRIKEKTGWTRIAELSRRLGELRVPSRQDN